VAEGVPPGAASPSEHGPEGTLAIRLRDLNPSVVSAWQAAFAEEPLVEISCGHIFDLKATAVVSPANSFGYMDGGIDLVYSQLFGYQLESRLQALLQERHYGELPVGQAVVLPTEHAAIPFLVSAPTMRVPSSIARSLNVYLAFRAALIAVLEHNARSSHPISSLLVPGLGTGVGEVPPERAARQMKAAYDAVMKGKGSRPRNLGQIWGEHQDLLL
jgi:O-acetyl-ADP-ribose deacetylase (regulator of RNase III)